MMTRRLASWLLGALGLAIGLGVAAAPASAQPVAVVEAARAALPAAMREAGVLRIATSLQWPPFGFKDEQGGPAGIDLELLHLLAAKLGLRPEVTDVRFPAIVPGISSGRFDVGANQMARTAERERVVQFVVYFRSEMGLLVRRGTTGIDVNNLCGRTLALTQGSSQVAIAEQISARCVREGKREISFLFFPNSADTYLAVSNGRGDGFLTGAAVGTYIAQHNNRLQMTNVFLPDYASIAGIVIGRENNQLATAIRLALESAIEDGSYRRILEKYGATEGILTIPEVRNPPER